uniref:Adrenodoxin-NADP(+) reductase n=1 Tax=Sexangularia sp. CB-2014 TaxID=1486929 RepID=A0A7S1YIM9_9EUKA
MIPAGLIRTGIAPDHQADKAIGQLLLNTLCDSERRNDGSLRFHVQMGHAWVGREGQGLVGAAASSLPGPLLLATGATTPRMLGVARKDSARVLAGQQVYYWYNGFVGERASGHHGWSPLPQIEASGSDVVIVGAGNVALDLARLLLSPESMLRPPATDMPSPAIDQLVAHPVRAVHIVVRRGAAEVKFTNRELRETLKVAGAVHLTRDELADPADPAVARDRTVKRRMKLWRETEQVPLDDARLVFHFHDQVSAYDEPDGSGPMNVRLTSGHAVSGVRFAAECLGFTSDPLPALPYDAAAQRVPTDPEGRVTDHGVYATGWARRGPEGIIASNKFDAEQVVQTIVDDAASGRVSYLNSGDEAAGSAFWQRYLQAVAPPAINSLSTWRAWDEAEQAAGEPRVKTLTQQDIEAAVKCNLGEE